MTEKMETGFKMYISAMSSLIKHIDPSIKELTYVGWMQDIASEFPYYRHTNPEAMAIAKYMVQTMPGRFDKERALQIIKSAFTSYVGKKDTSLMVVDVARYWTRLSRHRANLAPNPIDALTDE